jgi:hypothetical protein
MRLESVLWAAALLAVSQFLVPLLLQPERQVRPAAGAAVCLSILGLRVVLSISVALFVLDYTSTGDHLTWIPAWCLHLATPLSLLQFHPGLGEHALGDIARLLPAIVIATATFISIRKVSQDNRKLTRWIDSSRLGDGPAGSVIVRDPGMLLAVAGVRSPRVLVSPSTLVHLDDEELEAGLQHEFGHIERRHQTLSAAGSLLLGLSRPIPGGDETVARLRYFLERDADEFAVSRTADPSSLARAICKLSTASAGGQGFAITGLKGAGVSERLGHLVERRSFSASLDVVLSVSAFTIAALAVTLLTIGGELLLAGSISPPHIALTSQVCA